jgi:SPP1 gp7 family putative phage head morphogenesis protein
MATANEKLIDDALDHAIDLQRYSNGVIRRVIATLNKTDASLVAQLAEAMLQMSPDSFTVERLERLLADVREINAEAYAAAFPELEQAMQDLSKVEAASEAGMLRQVVPLPVQVKFPIAGIAWEQVYAAALARPFQGRLLSGWAKSVEAGRMALIRNAIRQGFVEGRTTADIIKTIRGTKANRYEDGILNRSRRELATIVQTALSHTSAVARQQTMEVNADLVKGLRWVSTLDSRTSEICRIRDGKLYTATKQPKPIGHSIPWGTGPGQIHFNCRSTSVMVLKSWQELGFDLPELSTGTRASMDGQVPEDLTYGQWFARQSAERQDEIVGVTRGKLFRDGKITFEKFYDDKGKWLDIKDLERRIKQ